LVDAAHPPPQCAGAGIAVDTTGRIGVGTVDDFGILATDTHGALRYHSLSALLPANLRSEALGEFESVVADGAALIFMSSRIAVRWDGRSVKLLYDDREKGSLRRVFVQDGVVYVGARDGLQQIGGPKTFASKRVDLLLGHLVVVRNEGLFTTDEKPLPGLTSDWLKGKTVMDGCILRDGRLVLTTVRDGVVIVDRAGNLEQIIGREAGLAESLTYSARPDREGALWIVHDLGMVRVDLASPVIILDDRIGLKGSVHDVVRHQGAIMAMSSHGLYRIDEHAAQDGSSSRGAVSQVEGVPGSPWCAVSFGDELLVGTNAGLYVLPNAVFQNGGTPQRVAGTETTIIYSLAAAPGDRSHLYAGTPDGLASFRQTAGGGWRFEGNVPGAKPYVRTFVEFHGELWCGTSYDGGMRIEANGTIHPFGSGLLTPLVAGGRMVITTDQFDGRFLSLTREGHLVPDPILGNVHSAERWDYAQADGAGNIWLNSGPPSVIRRLDATHYELDAHTTASMPGGDVEIMRLDTDGAMWIGGDHGLYHVASGTGAETAPAPQPVIRRIVAGNERVLFGGFGTSGQVSIPYAFQRLRIEVGPASFRRGVHYQYRLEPVDEHWSAWRDEALLEYTNLSEGTYTFRVHTRGASGQIGPETSWTFTVLPPWYRTLWAFLLWTALFVVLIVAVVRLRTRSLHVQAETLRARVEEQTIALREANARLEILAVSDDLTGIPNRREFERALAAEWERGIRHQTPLALILLDLDHFKDLNDTRGHQAGDECLRRIGAVLFETIRGSADVAARYGGEEFALLLPTTDAASAAAAAERLRQIIERMRIEPGLPQQVITASFGIASVNPTREADPSTLVARADRALYVAKRSGRNCVRIDDETTEGRWLFSGTA
jgi:diguanylate cyclase (GGDEF)-like protein